MPASYMSSWCLHSLYTIFYSRSWIGNLWPSELDLACMEHIVEEFAVLWIGPGRASCPVPLLLCFISQAEPHTATSTTLKFNWVILVKCPAPAWKVWTSNLRIHRKLSATELVIGPFYIGYISMIPCYETFCSWLEWKWPKIPIGISSWSRKMSW